MTDVRLNGKAIIATPIQRLIISTDAIDRIRFTIPRYWGGHDLSTANWIMKFELPSGDKNGVALDIDTFESSAINLDIIWDPSGLATSESGRVRLQIQANLVDGSDLYVWQSKVTPITVDVTIPVGEVIPETQSYLETFIEQITTLSLTTVNAKDEAETFAIASALSASNASGHESTTSASALAAAVSEGNAETYKNDAESASTDAEGFKTLAETASNNAIALYGDLATISGLVDDAILASSDAEGYKDLAQTAKGESEDARDIAVTAKTDVLAIYGSAQAVADAQTASEAAQLGAETARDELLEDAGFIGVVADLEVIRRVDSNRNPIIAVDGNEININKVAAVDSAVDTVAAAIVNVNAVANNVVNINAVAGSDTAINAVALKLTEIQTLADNVVSMNTVAGIQAAVSALALIEADITSLNGIKTDVTSLNAIKAAVSALALRTTEIIALGARTVEIDALYAEIDQISAKATVASVSALEGELDAHIVATKPHQFEDLQNTKTYNFGFQLSAEGNPQIIMEEIV